MFKTLLITAATLLALATSPVVAAATGSPAPDAPAGADSALTVTFVHPEAFTDASRTDNYGSDPYVLSDIRRHLEKLAARQLPPGYTLAIDVLDIDLAGYIDWRHANGNLRVIRDATWPRMTLSYVLRHGDDVVASANAQRINSMSFAWGVNVYGYNDPLRYEKAMLDEWFARAVVVR
ncbi:DUF3016 domain-containing protein [Cupriavidus pampae]|uniref:DUF3016 domain-containing protein n=1 Tax=Cupriavidus pampae TaxID=659251 RepID=A0ABM8WAV8_9BURK|nr:DUF3016 domain-containing protein [Cupriavidus pampae]CAG9164415.1 hypothetical protein LMG32289_00758 [Cupriavidus pampae]